MLLCKLFYFPSLYYDVGARLLNCWSQTSFPSSPSAGQDVFLRTQVSALIGQTYLLETFCPDKARGGTSLLPLSFSCFLLSSLAYCLPWLPFPLCVILWLFKRIQVFFWAQMQGGWPIIITNVRSDCLLCASNHCKCFTRLTSSHQENCVISTFRIKIGKFISCPWEQSL